MLKIKRIFWCSLLIATGFLLVVAFPAHAQEEQGSIGVEGRIPGDAPTQAATISVPVNGQVFTEIPITVSGLCPADTLVKLFKNNVFGGSDQCRNGSFSITTDLFNGQNELIVRVYDALDQAGPDSNLVTVTYNDPSGRAAPNRPSLTSNFAKRGANPGQALAWPIILSGGTGPYAISVDWGDGKPADLFTEEFAGTFEVEHIYDNPGAYTIIVRASDANGNVAFLQLVGIGNGALAQDSAGDTAAFVERTKVIWQPFLVIVPLLFVAFWLGKRYQLKLLRKQLSGDR